MPTTIRLLGRPGVTGPGDELRTIAGQKPWALLAMLALSPRGLTRAELAERIWGTANDPLGALRWGVLQVRRAISPDAGVVETEGRLRLTAGADTRIDVVELLEGRLDPRRVEHTVAGGLLERLAFDDAPELDQWLALQRALVDSAAASELRRAALLDAVASPDRAIRLAERALAIEPFDDATHELIVSILVERGDRGAAEAYATACAERYAAELGEPPPDTIRRPLERPAPAIKRTPRTAARAAALLASAEARLHAGDYEPAIDVARRAAAAAAANGDEVLEARALSVLAGTLIHTVRGRDRETRGLLDRALQLATRNVETALAGEVERELAWVALLEADYGAAEAWARRAAERARAIGDAAGEARALTILGTCQSDRGEFETARQTLHEATAALAVAEDRWEAFAASFLARLHVRTDDPMRGRELAARAVALARHTGWLSLLPWPMAVEAEATLALGDREAAAEALEEAYALALEIGDPCWEAFCLRGMALVQRERGHAERARELMAEALARAHRLPDVYTWARAVILTELVELEHGTDAARYEAARALVERSAMGDLAARLARLEPQTPPQTLAS